MVERGTPAQQEKHNLVFDVGLIAASVAIAALLVKTDGAAAFFSRIAGGGVAGSFFAGMFFISVFTAAPAGAVLFEIASVYAPWIVALFGAAGATLGDLLLFRFMRDRFAKDLRWLVAKPAGKQIAAVFHFKLFRWLVPFFGALAIASPLPDEVGLALLGLSRIKVSALVPFSFSLHFLGILAIGLMARSLS